MASVYLVARTTIDPVVMDKTVGFEADPHESNADTLAEFAGRNCYQSFRRPNPKTAANKDYLANILRKSHESVLEHSSATFYVEGCSRSLLAELSRHRHLSFSVVSQRYVDAAELDTVDPPALHGLPRESKDRAFDSFDKALATALDAYQNLVEELTAAGLPRKKAREAARAVLPQATDSPMVVTGNLRAWRDVIRKRFHVAADAEIQQFAAEVLTHLRSIAPNSFQDIPEVPYE